MEPGRFFDNSAENPLRYHSEMPRCPMFRSEVERTLYYRWRDHHDISAAQQLVAKYLDLVSKIAGGYLGYGIPWEELIGEGYIGLMRAVCRFDPGSGVRFTAYAAWRVREAIHKHMAGTMGMAFFQMAMLCTPRGEHGSLRQIAGAT